MLWAFGGLLALLSAVLGGVIWQLIATTRELGRLRERAEAHAVELADARAAVLRMANPLPTGDHMRRLGVSDTGTGLGGGADT